MLTIIILVLAVSLDALSFGLAQGFSKNSIPFLYALSMSVFSTILFTIPLYTSFIVIKYLDEKLCNIINGIVLLVLGIIYLFTSFMKKETVKIEKTKLSLGYCLASTIPISLDAIFTAFLNGYTLNYAIFGIIFYFVVTFTSIYVSNKIALKATKIAKINISWISGALFVLLGILKLFGF